MKPSTLQLMDGGFAKPPTSMKEINSSALTPSVGKRRSLNPRLQELIEAGLDPVDIRLLINSCLSALPVMLSELDTALAEGDCVKSARVAHRLVGSVGNVGLSELESVVRRLESCCRKSEYQDATSVLLLVDSVWQKAVLELMAAEVLLETF